MSLTALYMCCGNINSSGGAKEGKEEYCEKKEERPADRKNRRRGVKPPERCKPEHDRLSAIAVEKRKARQLI